MKPYFKTAFTAEILMGALASLASRTCTVACKYWPAISTGSTLVYWLANTNARPCKNGQSASRSAARPS